MFLSEQGAVCVMLRKVGYPKTTDALVFVYKEFSSTSTLAGSEHS